MKNVVPLVVEEEVDAESEEFLELRRVCLKNRKPAVDERAEEIGDLKAESSEFRRHQTSRSEKGEMLIVVGGGGGR